MKKIFALSDTRKLDFSKQAITDESGKIVLYLPKLQNKLLEILVDNNHSPVSYDALISYTWGLPESDDPKQNVRDIIKELKKIDDGILKEYITPKYGFGYKFSCEYPQTDSESEEPCCFPQTYEFSLPSYYISRINDDNNILGNIYKSGAYRVHAIIGERGIGKTTLAHDYANRSHSAGIYKHILFTSYNSTLKDTLEHLSKTSKRDPLTEALGMLANMQKDGETLLIIDNYDCTDFAQELSAENEVYLKLLETNCKVLLTSTSDLSHCYCIDDHVTHLSPLHTDELLRIFFKIRGESDDKKADVHNLIENYLLGNTYLTVLCAELSKQGMDVGEIIDSIKGLRADDTDYFSAQKDGKCQDEKTLLEHYCCVLNNNKVINPDEADARKDMHSILSILALLPIGGISSVEFDRIAYPYSKRKIYKKTIARLKKHNLVFENEGRIYLQPIVKEYLTRELLLLGEDTHYYLSALADKLHVDSYDDEMMRWVGIAESAYFAIRGEHAQSARERTLELSEDYPDEDRVDESINTAILLGTRITACYSSVNMFTKAYEFGKLVLPGLRELTQSQKQPFEMLTVATCYNIVGFAYLHGEKQSFDKNMRTAFDCIKKGIDYAERARATECDSARSRTVLSKLQGTFAAYYLTKKEYSTALEYHTRALREREQLISEDPENEEYRIMLAFTYRGIGTDHFYLSREADKAKNLQLSYINNQRSVELFEDLYGSRRLETVEGYNRLIGTALCLMDSVSEDEFEELIGYTEEKLIDDIYSRLNSVFAFYDSCGVSLNGEMADSLKKLIALTEKKISRGQFTKEDAAFNAQVAKTVRGIPTANGTCLDILAQLERIV